MKFELMSVPAEVFVKERVPMLTMTTFEHSRSTKLRNSSHSCKAFSTSCSGLSFEFWIIDVIVLIDLSYFKNSDGMDGIEGKSCIWFVLNLQYFVGIPQPCASEISNYVRRWYKFVIPFSKKLKIYVPIVLRVFGRRCFLPKKKTELSSKWTKNDDVQRL